jgi:bacterioferritin-associated ferredoxin
MYVCVCNAISDHQIVQAIEQQGLASIPELRQKLQLGTCCGRCVPCARQLLRQTLPKSVSVSLPNQAA